MSTNVTTQLAEQRPKVLIVDDEVSQKKVITEVFETKNLEVITTTTTTLEQITATTFYKIVWLADPFLITDSRITQLKSLFTELRAPVIIVLPVISAIENNDIYSTWSRKSRLQKKIIISLSSTFPSAHFIFLENCLTTSDTIIDFFIEHLDKGVIFDPKVSLPITQLVSSALVEESLLRPGYQQSKLISGQHISSHEIASLLQNHFYQVYQFQTEIRKISAVTTNPIPFTVEEQQAAFDSYKSLSAYIKTLDNPNKKQTQPKEMLVPKPIIETRATLPQATTEIVEVKSSNLELEVKEKVITPLNKENLKKSISKTSPTETFSTENDVQDELSRIFTSNRTEKKITRVVKLAEVEHKIVKKSKHKKILFWGGLSFVGIGIVLVCCLLAFYVSTVFVKNQLQAAVTAEKSEQMSKQLAVATTLLDFQTRNYAAFIDSPYLSEAIDLVQLSQSVSSLYENTRQTENILRELYQQLFQDKTIDVIAESDRLHELTQQMHGEASFILEATEKQQFEGELPQIELERLRKELQETVKSVTAVQQLSLLLPQLLGQESPRKYAFVFQNNQELRPTGGFIQAVAVVTLAQGKIIEKNIYSSYELDSKLSGVVEPPQEIKDLLGEEQWYLRDSNWDPDFAVSAERVSWFVENSTGSKIDGVFTFDIFALEKILKVTGPMELPQFNEVITDKNIAERLEFHSEVTLVNSDKNPDYSTVLVASVIEKLQQLPEDSISEIFNQARNMTREQNMLISLMDDNENMTIKALGWAGTIISPNCPSSFNNTSCFVDSMAQIEANVGVNKANYYLEKSVNHVVTIDGSSLLHRRSITYKNSAQTNTWPKGSYKAFVRLYVPSSTDLKALFVNTTPLPQETISIREEKGLKIIGFLIEVPINSQSIVEIEYTEPFEQTLPYSYSFFEQKQPGTGSYPFTLTVVAPVEAQPTLIAPEAQLHSNTVLFQENLLTHGFYGIQFK